MAEQENAQDQPATPEALASLTLGGAAPTAPAASAGPAAAKLPAGALFVWGLGRRKKSTARVRIRPGSGQFTVNKRPADKYFVGERDRNSIVVPLVATNMSGAWDVFVNVNGGGPTGQAGAICLGLSRALLKAAPEVEAILRGQDLLTRDARSKERKKYGQRGARRRFQFSKR